MDIKRSKQNPIIQPSDIRPSRPDFKVIGVFNAGVARLKNEIILLMRVAESPINARGNLPCAPVFNHLTKETEIKEFSSAADTCDFSDPREIVTANARYLTSISHLRVARSTDGINFAISLTPTITPENQYDSFGIEDPRVTEIDGIFYITYSAISPLGIVTNLALTKDFITFKRQGVIFCPDNKDVAIFPAKIDDKYYALHRPSTSRFGKPEIWIAESPDLLNWGNHRHLLATRGNYWDNNRVGASAVPFTVNNAWLEIYHGASVANKYCLGAALLDGKEPWKVIARLDEPLMEPQAEYEKTGFFPNVVFSCGALCEDGVVKIYYGAADQHICYAELALADIMNALR